MDRTWPLRGGGVKLHHQVRAFREQLEKLTPETMSDEASWRNPGGGGRGGGKGGGRRGGCNLGQAEFSAPGRAPKLLPGSPVATLFHELYPKNQQG